MNFVNFSLISILHSHQIGHFSGHKFLKMRLNSEQISKIVQIFEQDPTLLNNHNMVAVHLGTERTLVAQLKLQLLAGTITFAEFFSKVLADWVTSNGENATVSKLCEELREMQFIMVAGKAKFVCSINNYTIGICTLKNNAALWKSKFTRNC